MSVSTPTPRELYVDPASWERERERVLFREWTCVGRVADLGLDDALTFHGYIDDHRRLEALLAGATVAQLIAYALRRRGPGP